MESAASNQTYSDTASQMQGLSTREGQLASLESSQLQDYTKRWFSSSDASNAENQSVAESMRIVGSEETSSARDSCKIRLVMLNGGSFFIL
jgi:hypothetical protein